MGITLTMVATPVGYLSEGQLRKLLMGPPREGTFRFSQQLDFHVAM